MKRLNVALLLILLSISAHAVDIDDTRLLADPAISANLIAFAYANDIWVANPDGTSVRRLTSHVGVESGPRFSPDGALIAFTGRYEGNTDVYVVASGGGVPKRLTWHPLVDTVLGFTPDGASILFSSPREVHTRRFLQLFTVPVGGGAVTKLPMPNAARAAYSPDGKKLVYQPLGEAFREWKNYRGGMNSRLMLFDLTTYAVEAIPQPPERCNDTDPMWIGDRIYFRSDRPVNGTAEFNVFSFDPATKKIAQLTTFTDFPVLNASSGAGRILFEQAGWLHQLDPSSGRATRLKIGVAADLVETRSRFAKGAKYMHNASLSPSGARAAIEFRGEILTVPAEKGDDRNLTQSVAANDRSPIWSPDGQSIAYFTDETGEYELRIVRQDGKTNTQDGKGTPRKIKVDGAGFYENPKWSPDGARISYSDNAHSVWIVDVASGASTKISDDALYVPDGTPNHNWSPDSKWLAYTRVTMTNLRQIHLWNVDQKKSFPLTDALSDAREPVFDKESDEETAAKPEEKTDAKADAKSDAKADEKKPEPVKVTIDFDRLTQRIQALPVPAAIYSSLEIAKTGQLFYLEHIEDEASLQRFDLTKRKDNAALDKADGFELSRDGKRVLVQAKEMWSIADVPDMSDGKIDTSKRKLAIDAIAVRVEPLVEWRQIFDEAWRINRDYFYDPNYHGADWKAMKVKYAVFLPHVAVRQDLNRVMQWMSSELSVGHHRLGGGDTLSEVDAIKGGLLGADYKVENGRYRFAKVFGGLNWNPDLRSPLTEPGVDVKDGEYLLAVDGKDLRYPENLYARFERTAGRIVEITVGENPDGTGSRTVKVVPIEDESALRNRDWVERNLRYVTTKTNGRVAYVYVPNTAELGHEYFKRYFFPQADRDAIIVDERYNGGGQVADYYIDILRRPLISWWALRYGADLKTPLASIQGPKVMIIDETAGSGGDLLPWMFRRLKIGTIVGRRTWGGLVGILGFPDLMDGGAITAPNLAFWNEEGFTVENEGVPPDIEVEQTPADVIAGRDPQLDKAIEVVLKQLAENPPVKLKRPPYPVRVRK